MATCNLFLCRNLITRPEIYTSITNTLCKLNMQYKARDNYQCKKVKKNLPQQDNWGFGREGINPFIRIEIWARHPDITNTIHVCWVQLGKCKITGKLYMPLVTVTAVISKKTKKICHYNESRGHKTKVPHPTTNAHHFLCHFVCVVLLDVVIKLDRFVLFVLVLASLWIHHSKPQLDHITTQVLRLVLARQLNLYASVLQKEIVLQQQLHGVSVNSEKKTIALTK